MAFDSTKSSAVVDQSVRMPDYFSCKECAADRWRGEKCDEFQAKGRCRAEMLGQALQSGALQLVLHLPAGLPAGLSSLSSLPSGR